MSFAGGRASRHCCGPQGGDFSGLQANILALLRNTLNKHEECGERLSVNSSRLTPHVTKARLEMSIRFQKWTCIELFGRDHPNKLFSQSGDLTFLLTPEFDKSQLILSPELESINASGLMSPILESDYMKDKVQEVLERDVSGKLKLLLPEELSNVEVSRIEFKNANGQLHLILNSHIIVSSEEFLSLINKIRND